MFLVHTLLKTRCPLGGVGSPRRETTMNADLRFPQWQEPLLLAMMETSHENLNRKIGIAEQAVLERLKDLRISEDEKFALHDALSSIRVLSDGLTKSASAGT